MASNNYQQFPFWDFVRQFDQSQQHGAGVDHPAGDFYGPPPPPPPPGGPAVHHGPPPPPFGFGWGSGGPWGRGFGGGPRGGPWGGPWGGPGGHRGRHGRHEHPHGRRGPGDASPEGDHHENSDGEHLDGERSAGEHPEGEPGERSERSPHGHGRGPRGPGYHCRGGGRRHEHRRGGWEGGPRGFGGPEALGGFDLNGLMAALAGHPIAQTLRNYAGQYAGQGAGFGPQQSGETLTPEGDDENNFIPPIDVFSTEKAYILHVALPGAKKEDVGVNWDEEKGVLNVAGVVYRQGDEAFLQTLTQSERKMGTFERTVKLPPGDAEKEEVDSDMITAKLENGVLVVTVPKIEKEWTEVRKVDIQ